MFIEVNLKNTQDQYVLYSLTNPAGELIHVGIVRFSELTALSDVPAVVKQDYADRGVFLAVIKTDDDRLKLGNVGLSWLADKESHDLRNRLTGAIKDWSSTANNNEVECIETGEIFVSATQAAEAHDLTYGQLLKHLNGVKSFNSVKGNTYRRIAS